VALPAPSDREKSQMYIQRYIQHFPAAGEVVIFDRSYYNRAGVERVMGFCPEPAVLKFLEDVPKVEKAMVDSGIVLIKYWLEVSEDEQTRRLSARIDDGRKIWKLSPMDLKSYSKWFDYSRARDDMFKYTHTAWAPWIVADSNDKKKARLNIISDLLSRVPYKQAPREKIKLPKREKDKTYREPRPGSGSQREAAHPQAEVVGVPAHLESQPRREAQHRRVVGEDEALDLLEAVRARRLHASPAPAHASVTVIANSQDFPPGAVM